MLQQAGERIHIMHDNPTAENIARRIFDYFERGGFPVTEVAIYETESAVASYRRGDD